MSDTLNISIRNFPSELWRNVRMAALNEGIPLASYIARALEHAMQVKQVKQVKQVNKDSKLSELSNASMYNISDVQSNADVPTDAGRESVPSGIAASVRDTLPVLETKPKSKAIAKTCKHGTAKGFNCWQCGGIAQIE